MRSARDMPTAARTISRRLFLLVFRALAGMLVALVGLMVLSAWAVMGWVNSAPENLEPVLATMLETHYQATGSWAGVQTIFDRTTSSFMNLYQRRWDEIILVDNAGRVVVDGGGATAPGIGQTYQISANEVHYPLQVNGQVVGQLVFHSRKWLEPLLVFIPVIGPFSVVAILMAMLALLISFLLVRRVVMPLSEVIAAAQSVSEGNFSTRVKSSGPSDLRALSDSFNQMAESLESNQLERRELLAIVAHELRTPLSVLRGQLEGIVDGIYPADQAHIAGALEETYLLERLVEDLRLLALAEARQLHFDRKPVDLAALAQRAEELFAPEADEKAIKLHLSAEENLPSIEADTQRMEQAIGNLIGNALRYVPEGGRVDISIHRLDANRITMLVSDNGPGVPEKDLPHIFDRFWRGETARTRLTGGSGLGLAIAKELVEAQGGTISARNNREGGLEVSITFPLGAGADREKPQAGSFQTGMMIKD